MSNLWSSTLTFASRRLCSVRRLLNRFYDTLGHEVSIKLSAGSHCCRSFPDPTWWTVGFHHAARDDKTDHLSSSSQPLIYCERMEPIRANKFQRAKKKGKEWLSSITQKVSRSPSQNTANRTPQPDPPSTSQLTPAGPAHSSSTSARPSVDVGMLSPHQSEDFKGVSETPKQDDHPVITIDTPQSAPHAVSVLHSFGLYTVFCPYIRALIILVVGYFTLYRCITPRGQPGS